MRHRKSVKKLGRTASHRKALLANLAAALFERKHIKTTEAKAKAARSYSEKLITIAKKDTVHAHRLVFKKLQNKRIVKMLFDEVAPKYSERNGGYTRVIKLGQRPGDGAHMAVLELVEFEKVEKKKAKADSEKHDAKKKDKKISNEKPATEEKKDTKKTVKDENIEPEQEDKKKKDTEEK